jgi:hypothetical protein
MLRERPSINYPTFIPIFTPLHTAGSFASPKIKKPPAQLPAQTAQRQFY